MSTTVVRRSKQAALLLAFAVGCVSVAVASCANDERATEGLPGDGTGNSAGSAPVCDMPRPGCACSEEGKKVVCGEAVSEVAGQKVCGLGVTICEDGFYGTCIINNTVTLEPGTEIEGYGLPATCNEPCDPYCNQFLDDPSGLGNPDAGTTEGNGGITLVGSDGGVTNPCTGGQSGTCAHTICEPGAKLTSGCDGAWESNTASTTVTVFSEPFANNNAGWNLGTEWQFGPASASGGHNYGNPDPATDTTPTADNRVAGVNIGGNASTSTHGYRWLTSPTINAAAYTSSLTLTYRRWLNSDYPPWMDNRVEVSNNGGASWTTIWSGYPTDASWQTMSHDVTAYASANFRVRFGHTVGSSGAFTVSSWNLDDVTLTGTGQSAPTFGGSCVSQVCAVSPACCSTGWTAACVAQVASVCNVTCACTTDGFYVGCYKDTFDHDGDGYDGDAGDCMDCDPFINAGANDFANGIDDDCNGTVDDEPKNCDGALPLSTTNIWDHARAIDICRQTTQNATGTARSWGLITAASKLVQADRTSTPHILSHGIMSNFGNNNVPYVGTRMGVYSSGTARMPGQAGYANPNGQVASYDQGQSCSYPAGFPANAAGCSAGWGGANDSTGMLLTIRVPTNAKSFSYNFNFFSSEYPEWVCTAYNDHFVALMNSLVTNKNISFDANNNPVSVNVAFFTVPGCPTCTSPVLTNTGFDGTCWGQICGGATNWLYTTAPVTPGEDMTLHFSVWDMSDHVWDSTVLLDGFTWSAQPAIVQTGVVLPPPVTTYADGYFIRDYDASGVCPSGYHIVWGHWSWNADTPGDSYIDFKVRTAATAAGLGSAPEDAIVFTNPPGPAALAGNAAVAKSAPTDTQLGAAVVDTTLTNNGRVTNNPYLRVVSHLAPTSNKLQAPTLKAWNMQFDCLPAE